MDALSATHVQRALGELNRYPKESDYNDDFLNSFLLGKWIVLEKGLKGAVSRGVYPMADVVYPGWGQCGVWGGGG